MEGRIGTIRFHENLKDGTVHFHKDSVKIKCCVPFAIWWGAWKRLSSLTEPRFQYVDMENETMLHIEVTAKRIARVDIEVRIDVYNVRCSDDFLQIAEFSKPRK